MKLSQILKAIDYGGPNLPETEINNITTDSRRVGPGSIFVCIKGEKADGHDFAAAAAGAGTEIIVAEHETGANVPQVIVSDTHSAYSLLCAAFFSYPSSQLKLVGVTGTKGKSTTACVIKHILEHNGHKCGLIGTISNMAGDKELPSHLTTPEPFELQKLLRLIADEGCEYAVMEVSSHALDQKRVAGLHYCAGIFTNLSRDHLDYHKTMENYLKAKERLFEASDKGIINLDDKNAKDVIRNAKCPTVTFSEKEPGSDYHAVSVALDPKGISYKLAGKVNAEVTAQLPGDFSVYNTLAALSCAFELGIPAKGAIEALKNFPGVKGRIEVVPTGRNFSVILDYAHSPESLHQILKTVKAFAPGRVVALFGCGGDRDKGKRPQMGAVAAQNADFLVVTSDNPRTERPNAIIDDILEGLEDTTTPYAVIENRREAIEYALKNARPNDTIVLAGKGHEDYQILGTKKIHFDEREVVAEILTSLAK